MKKNGKGVIGLSAQRYISNAKETLQQSEIELGHYKDAKYVAEASGMAYLAALKAIYHYAEKSGLIEKNTRPKSYEGISHLINRFPQKNKIHAKFKSIYDILHTGAYYNKLPLPHGLKMDLMMWKRSLKC